MKAAKPPPTTESITPSVHLEFIQNHLEAPGAASAQAVEEYHRALFLHHHAREWEGHRQQARTHQEALGFLEGRLKDLELRLSGRTRFIPATVDGQEDSQPTCPWNAWDLAMFAGCSLAIVALMAFGVLNISFNLLESGFVTFRENPFRSYLWAALLPVGALAVKVGWDFLADRRRRDAYLWTCLAFGLGGVMVWVLAYACVYPTLSKGVSEQIASLTVFDHHGAPSGGAAGLNFAGTKWVDAITVAGQAVAEIFLSAVLGMYLTSLYGRHRTVRLAEDPACKQWERERRALQESVARERARLGEATGCLVQLENQLAAFVAYGKSMFHREAARRQDESQKRQIILDQLSDHVRNHLETVGPGNRVGADASPVVRGNGG